MQDQNAKPVKGLVLNVSESAPLMEFLRAKLNGRSNSSIKQLLTHGCICLNNDKIVTKYNHQLKVGDVVTVKSAKSAKLELNHPDLKIVFEDKFLIVVEKREGMLSVATKHEIENTAYNILDDYLKRNDPHSRAFVVHRLDRETSGVMLFAKCREAQMGLRLDWNDKILERSYVAVAEGDFKKDSGTIISYLYEDKRTFVHSSPIEVKGSLRSITHYKVLKSNGKYTMVQLNLETGRTNQIRVHLRSIGHPVVGDFKYGYDDAPIGRMCLHAKTIQFVHPITQKLMTFEMPVPKSFFSLVE